MKTNSTFFFIAFSLLCAASASAFGAKDFFQGTRGDGRITEAERTVSPFTGIDANGSAEIRLHRSPAFRVVVSTDSNLQSLYDAKAEGSILRLRFRKGAGNISPTKLIVDVWCPAIEKIEVSGSGDVEAIDPFSGSALTLSCSGSGSFRGIFDATRVIISSSGSGRFALEGSAETLDVSLSGSGDFNSPKFNAKTAYIDTSGSGSAELSVSEFLKASISGSGNVRYSGRPKTDVSVSGSGKVSSVD